MVGESAPAASHGVAEPKKRRLSWWVRLKFEVVREFLALFSRVFSLKGLYLLGRAFGTCEYLLQYRRRQIFRRRLEEIFGESVPGRDVRRHTRNHFCRIRCDKIFYMIFDKLPRDRILELIRFDGREHLDEALERGKGAYVLFSHHGSHHVAACLFVIMGYKVAGVRDPRESTLRRYVQRKYENSFPEFRDVKIFRSDAFPRDLYRCFHENRLLGTGLDVERIRSATQKTMRLELFGKEREFLTGTVHIALRCQATIMTGFMVCEPYYRFHFTINEPLADAETAKDTSETVRGIMEQYARQIEDYVRAHPDHISRTK